MDNAAVNSSTGLFKTPINITHLIDVGSLKTSHVETFGVTVKRVWTHPKHSGEIPLFSQIGFKTREEAQRWAECEMAWRTIH